MEEIARHLTAWNRESDEPGFNSRGMQGNQPSTVRHSGVGKLEAIDGLWVINVEGCVVVVCGRTGTRRRISIVCDI